MWPKRPELNQKGPKREPNGRQTGDETIECASKNTAAKSCGLLTDAASLQFVGSMVAESLVSNGLEKLFPRIVPTWTRLNLLLNRSTVLGMLPVDTCRVINFLGSQSNGVDNYVSMCGNVKIVKSRSA